MNSNELKRKLKELGCLFETHSGGSGHLTVINPKNGRFSQLPMHGHQEIGTGLYHVIMKQLGLKKFK